MKSAKPVDPFTQLEIQNFIMPISVGTIIVLAGMTIEELYNPTIASTYLPIYIISGAVYIVLSNLLVSRINKIRSFNRIIIPLLTGIGLGYLSLTLPDNLTEIIHILVIFGAIATATSRGRRYAYLFLLGTLAISLPNNLSTLTNIEKILEYFMPLAVSMIVMEVIFRLMNTARQHIHRLETINKVSRQITQSLDTKQTLFLLDKTIQETLAADTFFIGILEGNEINLKLFYDEGEYFNETHAPIKGTLSGWVINNQKELFLPDMREEVQLDGVEHYLMGKDKTSLSWIGVPLKTDNVTGVLVLASYTVNAFDRADLELLINLGQHVTLALDNTIRHAQVEKQARLDSLTGVYNHGYFLKNLEEQAKRSLRENMPLSLIMLDVDFFKIYNDLYGHLVGDRVLQGLCTAIKHHIKQTDSVGRWGGEEFVISLPGADGKQALQIAKRIGETLSILHVEDLNQNIIPIPTISQGIAVYPCDADETYRLIDIADKRLYVAKERGRNQIEPNMSIWSN